MWQQWSLKSIFRSLSFHPSFIPFNASGKERNEIHNWRNSWTQPDFHQSFSSYMDPGSEKLSLIKWFTKEVNEDFFKQGPMKSILFVGKNRISVHFRGNNLRHWYWHWRGSFYFYFCFPLLSTCPSLGRIRFHWLSFNKRLESVYIPYTHNTRGEERCTTEFKGWRQTMVDLRQTIALFFFLPSICGIIGIKV